MVVGSKSSKLNQYQLTTEEPLAESDPLWLAGPACETMVMARLIGSVELGNAHL